MKQIKRLIFLLLLAVLFLVGNDTVAANSRQQSAGVTLTAEAGFDGMYKATHWFPVYITVANQGAAIDNAWIRIRTNDGQYTHPIDLPTQSNKELILYLPGNSFTGVVTVELLDSGKKEITEVKTKAVSQLNRDQLFYVVLSSRPDELTFLQNITGPFPDAAVAFIKPEQLPENPAVWSGIDLLVLNDVDTTQWSSSQKEALAAWVNTGGTLIATGGPNWQKTTAGVTDLLPVTIQGTQSVMDIVELRSQTGFPFRDDGPYILTQSSIKSGELLWHENGMPLLAKRNLGRGTIYFLALDPGLAPLADWDGNELVWAQMINRLTPLPFWAGTFNNEYSASEAVKGLPSETLPSAGSLFLFLFFYISIIGPVNYMVLKRIKRRELAWLTIPGIVILFTTIAYISGLQVKGRKVIVNQVSVVYGKTDGDQVRTQTILGIYSPTRDSYTVQMPGNALVRPFDTSGSGNSNLEISKSNGVTLHDLRVDVGSVETFMVHSYTAQPAVVGDVRLVFDGNSAYLEFEVENKGDFDLTSANVLLGSRLIALGDLPVGKHIQKKVTLTSSEAGGFAGAQNGYASSYEGTNSPLARHMDQIIGSPNYYSDPEVFAKGQLIDALSLGYNESGYVPQGVVTLVAWSEEQPMAVEIDGSNVENKATTLYFLELPFEKTISSGENVNVPSALVDWRVLADSGMHNISTTDFYFHGPSGWVEFEFIPWPEFKEMDVSALNLLLQKQSGYTGVSPDVRLWDWKQKSWDLLDPTAPIGWGRTAVTDLAAYVGPDNAVRIRLENETYEEIAISLITFEFTGDIK